MPQIIPTQATPAQTFNVLLNGQNTTITLRQLSTGLYMDLQNGGVEVVGEVICQNLNRIVRNTYLGFLGDLFFFDSTGLGNDPNYTGLGTDGPYQLIYVLPSEIPEEMD